MVGGLEMSDEFWQLPVAVTESVNEALAQRATLRDIGAEEDEFGINGVPRELWGVWCAHNVRIVEPCPDDTSDYPRGRIVEPWPCDRCTREQFEQDMRDEQAAREDEMMAAYRNL